MFLKNESRKHWLPDMKFVLFSEKYSATYFRYSFVMGCPFVDITNDVSAIRYPKLNSSVR